MHLLPVSWLHSTLVILQSYCGHTANMLQSYCGMNVATVVARDLTSENGSGLGVDNNGVNGLDSLWQVKN